MCITVYFDVLFGSGFKYTTKMLIIETMYLCVELTSEEDFEINFRKMDCVAKFMLKTFMDLAKFMPIALYIGSGSSHRNWEGGYGFESHM